MKASDLLSRLTDACRGGVNALRVVTKLEPAGGPGDKLFPPTYEGGKYATEKRLIDGQQVDAVLLDSVQSQANRMEAALLGAFRRGDCELPVLQVTIPRSRGDTVVTALDAPHRAFDAIFRDSLLDGKKFRESPLGQRLVGARADNATGLFEGCPTALVFGAWDSTSGEGGTHAGKFPRALVSEIVGLHATPGRKSASRIDPLAIGRTAATIYKSDDDMWTLDKDKAVKDAKGKAQTFKEGKPASINHGNVMPSISEEVQPQDISFSDEIQGEKMRHRLFLEVRRPTATKADRPTSGGVTVGGAVQTTVLSFPQLRRLHFPDPKTGKPSPDRDVAGRAVLAALALYAMVLQQAEGSFLRSRCHLIPSEPAAYHFVGATAQQVEPVPVTEALARDALKMAVGRAGEVGLTWQAGVIELTPTEKLVELVRRSDEKVKTEGGDADAGN
jgi:CRISPR-associated protein Csb1